MAVFGEKQILQLVADIERHNKLYYTEGKSAISDAEYDTLKEKLRQLDPNNAILKAVGATPVLNGKKFTHSSLVGSLNSVKDLDGFRAWFTSAQTKEPFNSVIAEPKMDGLTIVLNYKDGVLVSGATRGDGKVGEKIKHFSKLKVPSQLPEQWTMEVRGEGVCTKKYAEEVGAANPRNLAAGTVKRSDGKGMENVFFKAFEIATIPTCKGTSSATNFTKPHLAKHETEDLDFLEKMGFQTVWYVECKSDKDVEEVYKKRLEEREEYEFDMDGIVLKVNNKMTQANFGDDGHAPKYGIAWKFPADQAETLVQDIVYNIGKTGRLTPVLKVEPVKLSGATISNVTAHNTGFLKNNKIGIGATILIERSGDVIPHILRTTNPSATVYIVPTDCPFCNEPLRFDGTSSFCDNAECPCRIRNRIQYWIKTVGIENFGLKSQEKIMAQGVLADIADLYKIPVSTYQHILGRGMGKKVYDSVMASKVITFEKFLCGLGIDFLGETASEMIASQFFTLDLVISDLEKTKIDGLAEVKERIVNQLKERYHQIKELQACLVVQTATQKAPPSSNKLKGAKFLITGTLSRPRADIQDMIRDNGGVVKSSVTKDLNYLVVGSKPGSKLSKAQALGTVVILDEDEFEFLLEK
jgi:DNA ligase (NAD+)